MKGSIDIAPASRPKGEIKDLIVKDSVSIYMNTAGEHNRRNLPDPGGRAAMRRGLLAFALLVTLSVLPGCRLEMYDQAHHEPMEGSVVFADSQSARQPVPGTVARSQPASGAIAFYGESSGGIIPAADTAAARLAAEPSFEEFDRRGSVPMPVTRELLVRGQDRYNIYCSPCHGRTGNGDGMIVQRGFPIPPSFHIDRLRQAPDGHYYDVITNGFGTMYSYASRVPPDDRWAIAAYIRALQLSQNASVQDVPPQERIKLQGSGE